jgi:hypothetical protein
MLFCSAWREMVILATALAATEITFKEDDSVFPKPGSGFYLYKNLAKPSKAVATMRERNLTLLWGKTDLEPYPSTADLP